MLLTLLVNLVILPVAITFFNSDLSIRWVVFNSVSDALFILDLIINFRTGKKHFMRNLSELSFYSYFIASKKSRESIASLAFF